MSNQVTLENSIKVAKKLPFHVEAVPQNNVFEILNAGSDTSSKPVNIKIKIKNYEETTGTHGIISVPKLASGPKKVRLVSSDQTIMSFDLFMESENEIKTPKKPHCRFLQLFKPRGCLDPPFGEDNYIYKPKAKMLTYDQHEFTDEKNIDKIVEKSNCDLLHTPKKRSIEEIYSHSLITYPAALSSNEKIQKEVPNRNKMKSSLQNKTIISINEFSDTYFMPPKIQNKHDTEHQKTEVVSSNNSYDGKSEKSWKSQNIPTSLFHMPTNQVLNQGREPKTLCTDNKDKISDNDNVVSVANNSITEISTADMENVVLEKKYPVSSQNVTETETTLLYKTITTDEVYTTAQTYQTSIDTLIYNNGNVDNHSLASHELYKLQSPIKNESIIEANIFNKASAKESELNNYSLKTKSLQQTCTTSNANSLEPNKSEQSQLLLEKNTQSEKVTNSLQNDVQQNMQPLQENAQLVQFKDPHHVPLSLQEKTKSEDDMNLLQKDMQQNMQPRQNIDKAIQLKQSDQFDTQLKIQSKEVIDNLQKDLQRNVPQVEKIGQSIKLQESDHLQFTLQEKTNSNEIINFHEKDLQPNMEPFHEIAQLVPLKEPDHAQLFQQKNKQTREVVNVLETDKQQSMQPFQNIDQSLQPKESEQLKFDSRDKIKSKEVIDILQKDLQQNVPQVDKFGQSIELQESDHLQFTSQEKAQSKEVIDFHQKDLHSNMKPLHKNAQLVQLKESDHAQLFLQEKKQSGEVVNVLETDIQQSMQPLLNIDEPIQLKESNHLQFDSQEKIKSKEVIDILQKDLQRTVPQVEKFGQSIELRESDHLQFSIQEKAHSEEFIDFHQKDLQQNLQPLQENARSVQLQQYDHTQLFLQEKTRGEEIINLLQKDNQQSMQPQQKNGQLIHLKETEDSQTSLREKTQSKEVIKPLQKKYQQNIHIDLQQTQESAKSITNVKRGTNEVLDKYISDIIKNKYDEGDISILLLSNIADNANARHKSVEALVENLTIEAMSTKQNFSENKTNAADLKIDNTVKSDIIDSYKKTLVKKASLLSHIQEKEITSNEATYDSINILDKAASSNVHDTDDVVQGLVNNISVEMENIGINNHIPSTDIFLKKEETDGKETLKKHTYKKPIELNNLQETKDIMEHVYRDQNLKISEKDKIHIDENSLLNINLGFHITENEKNEILINSIDTFNHLELNPNKITVIKSLIRQNDSEIRIPINQDMDLTLQIKKSFGKDFISKMVIDNVKEPIGESKLKKDILLQETLETVHEKLFPLENIIRKLKQEADDLTKQQGLLRDILSRAKTESARSINTRTTCNCNKYFM
ncbi:uncharacterized protein LOC112047273 [Bicyclus anynana]|uniref:Uncharacterized protein LOC112047273 n=1 Tax=Bicyclus anynana TaxID=110368 RepID=A0A6J1N515_BICAN|nr:uncharacterized protein LOC112047273 [Bicyclus anynana]